MVSSPQQPVAGAARARRVFFTVALVALLGGVIFLATRHRPPPAAPLPEAHRKDLELRTGRWFAPGQTNGFTGLLHDTYDDGAMKSRSAVSNGFLHGLSQGWHTNGQQQIEEHFVAGTSHGLRTKWHPTGQKLSEVTIVEGQLRGTFRSWHENGTLAEEVTLKDGQPDGLSRAWFPSGFLKSQVTLSNGKVVAQKLWKDGEQKEAASTGPGLLSGQCIGGGAGGSQSVAWSFHSWLGRRLARRACERFWLDLPFPNCHGLPVPRAPGAGRGWTMGRRRCGSCGWLDWRCSSTFSPSRISNPAGKFNVREVMTPG